MNIRVFSSQEEMDDDFEEMMEKEQEKAYLEERINQQRYIGVDRWQMQQGKKQYSGVLIIK